MTIFAEKATARLVVVLVSRIQKRGTGDDNFVKKKRDISVRPTDRPVKEDHLQSWSRLFQSDQTEMVLSHLMYQPKFAEFLVEWKAPLIHYTTTDMLTSIFFNNGGSLQVLMSLPCYFVETI